jgi:hypothetical protein
MIQNYGIMHYKVLAYTQKETIIHEWLKKYLKELRKITGLKSGVVKQKMLLSCL